MTDVLTRKQRRFCMSRIRGKDTGPEMVLRRMLHAVGYRYRLHVRALPGCPDMVFPARKKVVFVHGCFWHRHNCKYGKVMPGTRKEFWQNKFRETILRDRKNYKALKKSGWQVLVIWECQLKNPIKLKMILTKFLKL